MTSKIYKSAQGKTVDLGTIMLKNEHVRAVGNMGVNARGDKLGSNNQVVETKSQQIQQQNNRTTTNVSDSPVHTSSKKTRKQVVEPEPEPEFAEPEVVEPEPEIVEPEVVVPPEPMVEAPAPAPEVVVPPEPVVKAPAPESVVAQPRPKITEVDIKNPTRPAKSPAANEAQSAPAGGLAGAIARSREIKQQLDPTRRQKAQKDGIRKI